eukprot:gene9407-19521_t
MKSSIKRLVVLILFSISFITFIYVTRKDGGDRSTTLSSKFLPKSTNFKFNYSSHVHDNINTLSLNSVRNQSSTVIGNSKRQSPKFAYVTLLHGIDSTFRYRGFLYNTLIMKQALSKLGSTADFIALVGFRENEMNATNIYYEDLQLLLANNVQIFYLPRLIDASKVTFAEMALLKVLPWSFIQYDRIQYLDGDVMPIKNMDCYFKLDINTFNSGSASPLNSGWYLAIPNVQNFEILKTKAIGRLQNKWNIKTGWGEIMPNGLTFRDGRPVIGWNFNGASLDQGLLTHYYVINYGNVMLLDNDIARKYEHGLESNSIELDIALECCGGRIPTDSFVHFTGRNKPWLKDLKNPSNKQLKLWARHLDSLKLSINSSNVNNLQLKPPLAFHQLPGTEECCVYNQIEKMHKDYALSEETSHLHAFHEAFWM